MSVAADSVRAESLLTAARRAWEQAVADFYSPPLPDPVIEYDERAMSHFYIDDKTWTVHINTFGVPLNMDTNEAEPYLRSICHHELQHYLVCPYDSIMSGMMFARARRHLNDATAMFVCNLFSDLIVDSQLLKRFPDLTHERILASIHDSAIRSQGHSRLWRLIVSCYRAMWGFPIPPSVKIDEQTYETAKRIVEITGRYARSEKRWPKACEEIAKVIKEWQEPEEDQLAGVASATGSSGGEGDSESEEGVVRVAVPLDVDILMGDPVAVRNGDMARRCMEGSREQDVEEQLERVASELQQRGGTLEDLRAVLILYGAGTRGRGWTRFWYRATARRMIRFEIRDRHPSSALPLTPEVWRLGDPVEELDIVQSLQAFPVLVPNLSTRKWLRIESFIETESKSPPDMLIVIDSSGSMTWGMSKTRLSGSYHLALEAAFGAMEFALSRGCRVNVINFSVGARISGWSRDRRAAEDVLLSYQGGGTVMPTKKISDACDEARSNVLVLLITDAEVANWEQMLGAVRRLSSRGHHLFLFHIGATDSDYEEEVRQELVRAGASVIPVGKVQDLVGLVIRKVHPLYRT